MLKYRPMPTFSKDLITRTIKLFKEEYNHDISEEEAELYLKSFADLYQSMIDLLEHQQTTQDKTHAEEPGITEQA